MKKFCAVCLVLAVMLAAFTPSAGAEKAQQIDPVAVEKTDAGITVTLPEGYPETGFFKLFWKNSLTGEIQSAVIPANTPEYRIETEDGAEYSIQLHYAKKRGLLPAKWKKEETAPEGPQGPAVWKVLWMEIDCLEYNGIRLQMSESNYRDVELMASGFEQFAESWTNGMVDIENTIIKITEPVTTLSWAEDRGYYLTHTDVNMKHYALYQYDMVFAVSRLDGFDKMYDGIAVNTGTLWAMPGFSYIPFTGDELTEQNRNGLPYVAIHEWIHTLDFFYSHFGLRIGNPDEPDKYGYDGKTEKTGFLRYVQDNLTMNVRDESGSKVGVPPEAWQYKPTNLPENWNLRYMQE